MYCFAGTDGVYAEETQLFSSQVNARQKKFPLLNRAMMKTLRPLTHAVWGSSGWIESVRIYRIAS